MGDVYVEAGEIKRGSKFPQDQFEAAKRIGKQALVDFITNKSGMTVNKPRDSAAGVLVNVILTDLIKGTGTLTCKLIGEFFELPSKEKLKIDVSPGGEGAWTGGQTDPLGTCVQAAVKSMMEKSVRTITAPKLSAADAKLIFVAFEVTYQSDQSKAPQAIGKDAVQAANDQIGKVDKLVAKDTRFIREGYKSGMVAYKVKIVIQEVTVDKAAKTAAIKFKGDLTTYPDDNMVSLGMSSTAKLTNDVSDKALIATIGDLAHDAAAAVLDKILQMK